MISLSTSSAGNRNHFNVERVFKNGSKRLDKCRFDDIIQIEMFTCNKRTKI